MTTDLVTYGMFVDGRFTDTTGDEEVIVVNPATEDVIGRVGRASIPDLDCAVSAARVAFDEGSWPRLSPAERSRALLRLADALADRIDDLIELNVAEAGATRDLAGSGQTRTPLGFFRQWAERAATFPFVEALPPIHNERLGQGVIHKEPVGVVAAITGFNFPVLLDLFKLGPALATGNTVVLKPSPYTPLEAFFIAEAVAASDLPPGTVNVLVGGDDVARALTEHPAVDMVTFTGSDTVGRAIMGQAAPTLKRVLLELGGKSPNMIFPDADLAAASALAANAFVRHSGQGCGTPTRVLVHESVHDQVVDAMLRHLQDVRVGDPADGATTMGPLIREVQRARVERYVRSGIEEGATVAFGGGRPAFDRGFYVEPTLFTNAKNSMQIAQDEIFGPVAAVIPFSSDDEAVQIANDSRYGLCAWVWAGDVKKAYAIAQRLRVGTVNVNGTIGLSMNGTFGGYKQSGIGRELSDHGLHEYVELKTVYWPVG
ncbi:MAG TPA: aldehyde dehydrogenase family protein [Acidimicrobiia bacterium]|nr:aldehyde dehydrogenase family protein [Acidimicrobiia bacterium]